MTHQKLLLLLLFLTGVAALAPLHSAKRPIPGQYIVKFSKAASAQNRASHLANNAGSAASSTLDIPDFKGYVAKLSEGQLAAVRADPSVEYVEADGVVEAHCATQNDAVWGLDRVSKATPADMDGTYTTHEDHTGTGVDAYIVDTGIRLTHSEFGGRALWGTNVVDKTDMDCNGHGTHVAGTVGGKTYGVAKGATLIAVKVLACDGKGTVSGIVQGLEWVLKSQKTRQRPSVVNLSIGGSKSSAINDAAEALVAAGITLAVSAGNSNEDACNVSPASAPSVITVGATRLPAKGKKVDIRADYSNYGRCVDILAPGSGITSAWHRSDTDTNKISGTSMASPHVAGAVAVLLSANPAATPKQVWQSLHKAAGNDLVEMKCGQASQSKPCRKTPNEFLAVRCA